MTQRITSGMSTMINPFGPQWPSGPQATQDAKPVGEQVQDALFGKKTPTSLDEDDYPDIAELMAKLDLYRKRFAVMVGDPETDYRLQLADGTIAMIDGHGTIYVGIKFLHQFANNAEVIIGALAHEVGHRPKRWAEYKSKQSLTQEELNQLCRYEETRADLFAGHAMAEMGLSVEPMIKFLKDVEEGPHPDYFPAGMRAEVLREGFTEQSRKAKLRRELWPELDRATSPKMHLGDF